MLNEINISMQSTLLALFNSAIGAFVLRYMYVRHGKSMNNREYFGNIFILLAVTTCSVIIIVKYSLALSLGLVGALSIVRFRAAIKEPEELVYLFLVIAFGLAFGANQVLVGYALLIISCIVIVAGSRMFSSSNGLDHSGIILIISGDRKLVEDNLDENFKDLLDNTSWINIKELDLEGNSGRLVFKISSLRDTDQMITRIRKECTDAGLNFNLISDVNVPS